MIIQRRYQSVVTVDATHTDATSKYVSVTDQPDIVGRSIGTVTLSATRPTGSGLLLIGESGKSWHHGTIYFRSKKIAHVDAISWTTKQVTALPGVGPDKIIKYGSANSILYLNAGSGAWQEGGAGLALVAAQPISNAGVADTEESTMIAIAGASTGVKCGAIDVVGVTLELRPTVTPTDTNTFELEFILTASD